MYQDKTIYVYELPTKIIHELEFILDPGNMWEQVAVTMPDIIDIDIEACKRQKDGRCTDALIRIWGSKGYTVDDFYKVFGRLKMVKCMQIIRHLVDEKLHFLEKDCLSLFNEPIPISHNDVSNHGTRPTVGSKYESPQASRSVYSRKTEEKDVQLSEIDSESVGGSSNVYSGLQNTLSVRYDEILIATNNFASSNILGRGGYGTVYKGEWKHLLVAVKRIQSKKGDGTSHEKERLRQSLQELRTLAKFRHDNILSLYGYSLDGPEPCLVYQYMFNGSLEDRLLCKKNTLPLSWETRVKIVKGVSCGLLFLHSIGRIPVIHGDVKSANILLDKHMEPKLGDFGLCRDGQQELDVNDKSPLIASHIKGTLAYLPPEFISSKILTTKLDVYSYGVVLLEVATGLRAYSDNRTPHGLVDYVTKQLQELNKKEVKIGLADKKMDINCFTNERFREFLDLGLFCSHKDRLIRPSFHDVMLKFREMNIVD